MDKGVEKEYATQNVIHSIAHVFIGLDKKKDLSQTIN